MSDLSSSQVAKKAKVVLLGQSEVGKTCIIQRYVNDDFSDNPSNTIGGVSAFVCDSCSRYYYYYCRCCCCCCCCCGFYFYHFIMFNCEQWHPHLHLNALFARLVSFTSKVMAPLDSTKVELELWDTSGQGVSWLLWDGDLQCASKLISRHPAPFTLHPHL